MQDEEITNPTNEEEVITPQENEELPEEQEEELDHEEQEEHEEPEAEEQQEEEQPEEEEEPEEKPVSRRQAKRIEQLLNKIQGFEEEDAQRKVKQAPSKPEPLFKEGDYSLEEINRMAEEHANKRYEEAMAHRSAIQFETRLAIDAPKVYSQYSFLDENSADFDAGRATLINKMYLNTVGYDPSTGAVKNNEILYPDFVDAVMELAQFQAQTQIAESRDNLVKQAVKSGPRPGGAAKKPYAGTDPTKMTDEQLDAIIAQNLGGNI